MNPLRSRLRRHVSYANVMASFAVFFALGGVGYAATSINGNKIINKTIGAGKLKKGTLTSYQVKEEGLHGNVINEASLGMVPAAQTAVSASTATSATTAQTATSAEHALSADTAAEATVADSALSAADADTLEGLTAEQLEVSCAAGTELFGGMCWDLDARSAKNWIAASSECGEAGGRLPSLSELIAYVLRPGVELPTHHWSDDVAEFDSEADEAHVLTHSEGSIEARPAATTSLGYRCLFYRVN